jgi:AsmA family protein
LITGEGMIDLESEGLDLKLQGHPKHPRLRLQTPVLVHGSWKHPTVGMQMGKPAMQAGGAVALGVLLSPVAALLAFVDPGLAKDANCALLLAQATAEQRSGGH